MQKLVREMLSVTDSVWHAPALPKELRELAGSIHKDVREIERVRVPKFKPKTGVTHKEAAAQYKEQKTRAARKRIAQKTDKFATLVKKSPKYNSAEFKCVGDYEQCQEHRGKGDIHCRFAYFICMAKKIIPFVRQK